MDDLGLVEAVDGFGESIVVRKSPTLPTEGSTPASARRSVYTPDGDACIGCLYRCGARACFLHGPPIMESLFQKSSRTLACAVRLTRQPTIRRA